MKYLLFIVLLVVLILSTGCVSQNNSAASTPTPHVYASTTPQKTVSKSVEKSTSDIQIIGNGYGLSTDNSAMTEIRFTIGLAPGASPIDLTKMRIGFYTLTEKNYVDSTPIMYRPGPDTNDYKFTTKLNGVTNVNSMNSNDRIEIAFQVPPLSPNKKILIEFRLYGDTRQLWLQSTIPSTITAKNVLYLTTSSRSPSPNFEN